MGTYGCKLLFIFTNFQGFRRPARETRKLSLPGWLQTPVQVCELHLAV